MESPAGLATDNGADSTAAWSLVSLPLLTLSRWMPHQICEKRTPHMQHDQCGLPVPAQQMTRELSGSIRRVHVDCKPSPIQSSGRQGNSLAHAALCAFVTIHTRRAGRLGGRVPLCDRESSHQSIV